MLRKHQKIVVLIIAVCFLVSMVGSAGAATFSDVSGTSTEASAIYKLNGLGIIQGYADGTFGADKTITRAEFAKIACSIAGLASVASGMSGTASSFSDVATDYWANGYINVAEAQGYMKGDTGGTFRPDDSVTQAEIVTVFLRLLGYNDNLSGSWPSDYIAKAATLGIVDDITFVSGQAATRGQVAIMGSATLDQNVVQYVASDNYFEEKTSDGEPYTLLTQNFDGSTQYEDMLVTNVDLSDGKIRLTVYGDLDNNTATDSTSKTIELSSSCVIADDENWSDILYRYVDFTINNDDEISSIIPKDYKVISMDPSDVQTKSVVDDEVTSLKLNDKKYTCADTVQMIMSDAEKNIFEDANNIGTDMDNLLSVDNIDFVLNSDGNIALIKVNAYPAAKDIEHGIAKVGIVDSVNKTSAKIVFKNASSIDLDEDDAETYAIIKDGKDASLDDIKADDLVYDYTDDSGLDVNYNYGLDHVLIVSSKTVSGTFESLETTGANDDLLKTVTIDNSTYDVPGDYTNRDYLYSDDEGESFDLNNDSESAESVLGDDITAWLSPTGKVVAIASGVGDSGKIYGVINDDDVQTLVNGKITNAIEIMKADGSLVTYAPDEDSQIWDGNASTGSYKTLDPDNYIGSGLTLSNDTLVQMTLNSDGYIDQIRRVADLGSGASFEFAASDHMPISGDKDNEIVTIDGESYDASNAVVFNTSLDAATDDDEVAVVSLSEFLDQADGTIDDAGHIVAKVKDGALQYLALSNENVLGSDNNVAMVDGSGTNSDGKYVKLMTTGDAVKYTVKSGTIPAIGKVMNYKLVNGKVVNETFSGWEYDGDEMTVDKITGNIFRIDGINYAVNSDTLYFNFTNDDPVVAEKGDFTQDDAVEVYLDNTGDAIAALVLVNATTASTQVAMPTASLAAGEVTTGSTVTFSTTTNGATIYYTTDGSTPTTSSTEYTGAITINSAMTIKAFAIEADKTDSDIATFIYTITDLTAYNEALAAVTEADYTAASWTAYQLVVSANVVTAENTQTIINTATSNIITAQSSLVLKADLTAYNEALAAVTEAEYTAASWTAYQLVVSANVVTAENSQTAVNTATSNITTAQSSLVLKADLTAYNEALAAVSEADYTAASWTAYQLVVSANVVTAENSQTAVNTATSNITTAQSSLVPVI